MFTSKTLAFLAENRAMNSREWFGEHKAAYEKYVLEPLRDLARELAPAVSEIDDQIVTIPAVDKTISRIWCDVRFSRGMLFREQQWISFRRDKKQFPGWPEFFIVFSPRELLWGCGYYSISTETMAVIRRMVVEEHPKFIAAKQALEAQSTFSLNGDSFKRSRYPSYSEDIRAWLDKKNLRFSYETANVRELFSEDLSETLKAAFRQMKPIYQFLICAESLAQADK